MFYTGIQSSVNVNGILSSFFSLSRGVRQGCPLSPLLYGLVAEVLACNILANPRIKGLCLPGSFEPLSPISQYADDTSLVVCSDDAIRACFAVYNAYKRGSRFKLNLSKSKGLWLGTWAKCSYPPAHFVFSGPCSCYQRSSFVPGMVCGLPHPHAPLGPGGTAEAGLQLFLEGEKGSDGSHCGCSGPLRRWILGGGCKVNGSVFVGSVNSSPVEVFSRPFAFSPRVLPPFYQSLLLAWRAVDGSFSRSWAALVMASSDPHLSALASSMTCYLLTLFLHTVRRSFSPSTVVRCTGQPPGGSLASVLLTDL